MGFRIFFPQDIEQLRMTDIPAAIGVAQLKKLDNLNGARINHAEYFDEHLKVSGLTDPYKKKGVKHVYS